MRYVATPNFTAKVQSLGDDPGAIREVSRLLEELEAVEPNAFRQGATQSPLAELPEGMYVYGNPGERLYLSRGEDADGEYLLLLDISLQHAALQSFGAVNDPRTNASLNPRQNASINPCMNASLNPHMNASINPRMNASINPHMNASINPRMNASINPHMNASINPRMNASINPRMNASLNPRMNRAYGGPFLYNLSLQQEGFLVRANAQVILLFDMSLNFLGIGVLNSGDGYTLFDTANEFTGQLVPNGQGGYVRFDNDNNWIGIAV